MNDERREDVLPRAGHGRRVRTCPPFPLPGALPVDTVDTVDQVDVVDTVDEVDPVAP